MVAMWNENQVVELTEETEAGSVRWSRALHGDLTTDRQDESLRLQRDEDGRHMLTTLGPGLTFVVLAESMNPQMSAALAALWDAADASAG